MPSIAQTRKALRAALKSFGEPHLLRAALFLGVSERTLRNYRSAGCLNAADAILVWRLARKSGIPIEQFLARQRPNKAA